MAPKTIFKSNDFNIVNIFYTEERSEPILDCWSASHTYVYADTNGDKNVDFAIHLDDGITLSKGYFVL